MFDPIVKSLSIFGGSTPADRSWELSTTTIKTEPINFQKRLKDLLCKVCSFIKAYFLFFCFDQDSRDRTEELKQIKSFIALYYEAKSGDFHSETKRVIREFKNLKESLKEDIKSQVEAVIKREFSNENTQCYEELTRLVLESPLHDLKKGKKPVRSFAIAIFRVQEKYAGFHETI
jgi:hypothetical protein